MHRSVQLQLPPLRTRVSYESYFGILSFISYSPFQKLWQKRLLLLFIVVATIISVLSFVSRCSHLSWYEWYCVTSRPHRLKKTSSKQSKRRDLQLKWLHRETNDNTLIIGNGNGIYIPHFLYVYNQMRFTFNHPTHESWNSTKTRPAHRELHALLFAISVWVL